MATTINPAVSRVSLGRWFGHLASYGFGLFAGGLGMAVAAALVLAPLDAISPIVSGIAIAAVVATTMARDLGLGAPVPYRNVQVAEWLRRELPGGPTALIYGLQLGMGFLTKYTYCSHTAFAALAGLLVLDGRLAAAVLAVAVVAATRSLTLLTTLAGHDVDRHEANVTVRLRAGREALRLLGAANVLAVLLLATALLAS